MSSPIVFRLAICFLLYIASSVNENESRRMDNKIYTNKQDLLDFVDINGLDEVVDFQMTLISTDFGFLEGPSWISTAEKQGYLLFTEIIAHRIWKYDESNTKNPFQIMASYPGCGPAGIAWNKNFADELWIACFVDGRLLKVDASTFEIKSSYDFNDFADNNGIPLMVDDVVMDSKGNIFFTNMPVEEVLNRTLTADTKGSVMMIARDKMDEIQLVQYIEYGPNGIAINADESIIVASNMASITLDKFSFTDWKQWNGDKMIVRGYRHNADTNTNVPFVYMQSNDPEFYHHFSQFGEYKYAFDSSGFDHLGNMWQAVVLIEDEHDTNVVHSAQVSIFNNNAYGTDPVYIGTIRINDPDFFLDNFELGGNNYMYATGGSWFKNTGVFAKFKLKSDLFDDKREL